MKLPIHEYVKCVVAVKPRFVERDDVRIRFRFLHHLDFHEGLLFGGVVILTLRGIRVVSYAHDP